MINFSYLFLMQPTNFFHIIDENNHTKLLLLNLWNNIKKYTFIQLCDHSKKKAI